MALRFASLQAASSLDPVPVPVTRSGKLVGALPGIACTLQEAVHCHLDDDESEQVAGKVFRHPCELHVHVEPSTPVCVVVCSFK